MKAHLLVSIELNGWRYEATHQPPADRWRFARARIAGNSPAHSFTGYQHLQHVSGQNPEDVLKTLLDWALTECTLY